MLEKLRWDWVFLSFVVGLLVVVVYTPPFLDVPRYPTPYDNRQYKTPQGTCYGYETTQIPCPADKGKIQSLAETETP